MKQLEVTEKTIGEHVFYIKPFPAFTAANISGELATVITPILGSLAPVIASALDDDTENIMDMDVDKALPSLSNAFSGLSGNKFEKLMKKLLIDHSNISVEGEATESKVQRLTYDLANEIFCGELENMYLLCFEVLKLNFGGFFKKLGTQFGDQINALRKKVPSSKNMEDSTSADSAI